MMAYLLSFKFLEHIIEGLFALLKVILGLLQHIHLCLYIQQKPAVFKATIKVGYAVGEIFLRSD